jgi:NRAMP (natural resistance-associated macrophage protein)-like metal ion transporter
MSPGQVLRGLWRQQKGFYSALGPGLITGAADDDPSGIATYSQAGASFGYGLGWSILLALPFMVAVQEISARLGRVTGHGLGWALRRHTPWPLLVAIVSMLAIANVLNLAADIGAMGATLHLLIGGHNALYGSNALTILVASICVAAEIWMSYKRYVGLLKLLTLSLLSYIALLFVVHVDWRAFATGALVPHLDLTRDAALTLVAVLGTTISPYLFFWQASEEAEDACQEPEDTPLRDRVADAPAQMRRIRIDTWVGMGVSNLVALAILAGCAATLHVHGVTTIDTPEQAAAALAPIAGPYARAIFAAGIIGTGLLAVPTLAGSLAYAIGESLHWRTGLSKRLGEAPLFYAAIAVATALGVLIVFSPLSPMRALFWSAVVNGVTATPMIICMVVLGSRKSIMGELTLPLWLRWLGWLAAVLMGAATVAMIVL